MSRSSIGRCSTWTSALLAVLAVTGSAQSATVGSGCDGWISAAGSGRVETERPAWAAPEISEEVWRRVEDASVTEDSDRRKCLLREAEDVARARVDEAPDDVDGHFALAVVLGLRADREGGRTKVRAASGLLEELRVVLELDPEHAAAHHLMGRLHAGVMRMDSLTRWIATHLLGGGALAQASWDEAERNLAFAEARAPQVLEHHYELARLYQDTHREALALEELGHVLERPVRSSTEAAVAAKAERLERAMAGR